MHGGDYDTDSSWNNMLLMVTPTSLSLCLCYSGDMYN